jgi:hypothetical protein
MNNGNSLLFNNYNSGGSATGYFYNCLTPSVTAGNAVASTFQILMYNGSFQNPLFTLTPTARTGINCNAPRYTFDVGGSANIQSNLYVPAIETSSLAVSSITLVSGNTSIVGQYNYTQTFTGFTGGTVAINNPNKAGLYAIVVRTTATDASSVQACLSAMGYYNTVSGWTYGGNAYSVLNGVTNGSQFAQTYVNGGALNYKTQGVTVASMSCAVIQIAGAISGF